MPDSADTSLAATRMMPVVTDLNRHFWTGGASGQLLILRCDGCDHWVHPPTRKCPSCGGGALTPRPVSGEGTVFTFTVNRHPYNPATPLPYVIAVVQLAEQDDLRLVTNLEDVELDDLAIGMPVRVIFEPHGEIHIPLFVPR